MLTFLHFEGPDDIITAVLCAWHGHCVIPALNRLVLVRRPIRCALVLQRSMPASPHQDENTKMKEKNR